MQILELAQIRLTARGRVLVDGFSLTLEPGARCTLTGPSGSGKTTLLKCILGFAQPAAGSIRIFGEELTPESVWTLRRKVAWVPQEPELGDGAALEAIVRPLRYRANRGLGARGRRIRELAAAFGLAEGVLESPVARLSGGEKQRVALIAALALERPLLLLDEASSALDPDTRAAIAAHLRNLENTAILSVAHDPDLFPLGGRIVELPAAGEADGTD